MDLNVNIQEIQFKMGSLNLRNALNVVQTVNNQNKRQLIFGPATVNLGPRPPISCELYITNLPTNLDITKFFQWLNRIGQVYEMRIMMNNPIETRGFCFVRFFHETGAVAAYELMSYLFLNNKRPNAQSSQCKRQLFAGGIPKFLSLKDVRENFKKLFPSMVKCIIYSTTNVNDGQKNRGFAFLEFAEHDVALQAKKYLKSTRVWGQFVKVDWARARPNEAVENFSPLTESLSDLKKNDYCAKLRLYAIANNWCIPIIVYGSNFKEHGVQYGGILLKDPLNANYSCIIIEVINMMQVFDIHVLLCEVATHLVEVVCGMPPKHYVVRVRCGATAKIVVSFMDISELFYLSTNLFVSAAAVVEMMTSLNILAQYQSEAILRFYKLSFQSQMAESEHVAMFSLVQDYDLSHFFCVYPKFRDNYPLNNNFNDTEIILLQATANCFVGACMTQIEFNRFLSTRTPDEGAFVLKSQRFNRHPNYVLNYVDLELLKNFSFYHPTQQVNTPPLWVRGETYQTSIFENF